MSDRTKHVWNVQLQEDTGRIVERKVRAFWDPAQEDTKLAIGQAAKAEAWAASHKQHEYAPIAVTLDDAA